MASFRKTSLRLTRFCGQVRGKGGEKAVMPSAPTQSRRRFDEAFKRDAAALLLQGHKRLKQLAQALDVSRWNLRDWRRQHGPVAPAQTSEQLAADGPCAGRTNACAPSGTF